MTSSPEAANGRGTAVELRKGRPLRQGVRITKVGLWFLLFAVIVGIAATNTGNNALYLVLASMLGLLVACWTMSRLNGQQLELEVHPPAEVFATTPVEVEIEVASRGRFFARRQLVVRLQDQPARVIHRLERGPRKGSLASAARIRIETVFARRGRQRLAPAQISSLYPLGLFRCARSRTGVEILVFPRLRTQPTIRFRKPGELGADSRRRGGWGHDLHALRAFRAGDDPRNVHWKQSARTGELVYKEHEAEECRRLAIVLDEGALESEGGLDPRKAAELEELVSEAATAAVDYLERGFEVELVTRQCRIPFAAGPRQRFELLEALALLEPCDQADEPLRSSDSIAPELRLELGARPRFYGAESGRSSSEILFTASA